MKKTFYFNTGVQPYKHTPPVKICKGEILRGGTLKIPFECENVPDNAIFLFASDNPAPKDCGLTREIHNSALVSKYAHFSIPENKA